MSAMLDIGATIAASEVRHRLALGLSLNDALGGQGATGPLRVDLEKIGPYLFPRQIGSNLYPQRFETHRADRHARRYEGRIKKLLDQAVTKGGDTQWIVRIYGSLGPVESGYDPARDPRLYVPRRLRFALNLDGLSQPEATASNIRIPWLWPGTAYPFPSAMTAIRGQVLRGTDVDSGKPIPWARVFLTTPQEDTNFAAAIIVGRGQGDGRGEFAISLERSVVLGAALLNPLFVRLWAFFPPPGPPVDPAASDPLDGLPIEEAGSDLINDVLRGYTLPVSYSQQTSKPVSLRLGETKSGSDTTLLFT